MNRICHTVVAVDPDSAGAEGVGDFDGGVEVRGVDGSGKTVGGAVADADGILLCLELGDAAHLSLIHISEPTRPY